MSASGVKAFEAAVHCEVSCGVRLEANRPVSLSLPLDFPLLHSGGDGGKAFRLERLCALLPLLDDSEQLVLLRDLFAHERLGLGANDERVLLGRDGQRRIRVGSDRSRESLDRVERVLAARRFSCGETIGKSPACQSAVEERLTELS